MFSFRSVLLVLLLIVSISEAILGQEKQGTTAALSYGTPAFHKLPALVPFRKGNLWGYADSTGRLRISPRFTAAGLFKNGRATVMTGDFANVIDTAGTKILKRDFLHVHEWNGLFIGQKKVKNSLYKLSGAFDKNGKTILPIKYYILNQFNTWPYPGPYVGPPLLYAAENRSYQKRLRLLRLPRLPGRARKSRQTYFSGLFDVTGKKIIPLKYLSIQYLGAGVIEASKGINYGTSFFYFTSAGKPIKALKGFKLQEFHNGLARAQKNYKQGFVDSTGRVIAALKYNEAKPFSEGLAAVRVTNKWGYINKEGEEVIPFEFDEAGQFNRGFAIVRIYEQGYGLIDRSGKRVSDFQYDRIEIEPEDKTFWFYKNGIRVLYGYRPEGSEKIFLSKVPVYFFKNVRQFGEVKLGDSIGYMDEAGKMLIRPMYAGGNAWQDPTSAAYGLLAVRNNEGWGVVNLKNEVVIPFGYKWVKVLNTDRFLVSIPSGMNQMKMGMIDAKGQEIMPIRYDKLSVRDKYLTTLPYGWIYAEAGNEISILDFNGQELMRVTVPEGHHPLHLRDQNMLPEGLLKLPSPSKPNQRIIEYLDWKGTNYFQD